MIMKQPSCLKCGQSAHYKLSRGHYSLFSCTMHLEDNCTEAKSRLKLPFLISRISFKPSTKNDYRIDEKVLQRND